jgi:hypothetical protein
VHSYITGGPHTGIYNWHIILPCPFLLLQPHALMDYEMAMRVEWIVVVRAPPAGWEVTALLLLTVQHAAVTLSLSRVDQVMSASSTWANYLKLASEIYAASVRSDQLQPCSTVGKQYILAQPA